jgi:hypothetical protein
MNFVGNYEGFSLSNFHVRKWLSIDKNHFYGSIDYLRLIYKHVDTSVLATQLQIEWIRTHVAIVHILLGVVDINHTVEPRLEPINRMNWGKKPFLEVI